jgi:thymidylate kinase
MTNKIIYLTGPDGTGKTTLARTIQDLSKGSIVHASYRDGLNVEEYHNSLFQAALLIYEAGDTVVLDRWAVDEHIYGMVFRDGPSYDTSILIEEALREADITFVYCCNDNAVENHLKNSTKRKEMFKSMEKVVQEFDDYVQYTSNNWIHIPWKIYDFDVDDVTEFAERLLK